MGDNCGYCVLKLILFFGIFCTMHLESYGRELQDNAGTHKQVDHSSKNMPYVNGMLYQNTEKGSIKTSLYDVASSFNDLSKGNVGKGIGNEKVSIDGNDAHLKGGEDNVNGIFVVPRVAKAFLRPRRSWLNPPWEQKEEAEENRETGERYNEFVSACRSTCWGSWSSYSSCSAPCGSSATRRSTRSRAPSSQCQTWVAQNGCPGSSVRTQACGRSCHNGGTLRPNDCSCQDGWTGTCCETIVRCADPGIPSNGGRQVTTFHYGSSVAYSCNRGYSIAGASSITCSANGSWRPSRPTCQLVSCADPGIPSNGRRQGTVFKYGSQVVYSCNKGYSLAGATALTCSANGKWSSAKPTCQRVMCHSLGAPDHGAVRPTSAQISHGSQVQYSCNNGHQLVGNTTLTCGGDGSEGMWSGDQPSCEAVLCGDPGAPDKGVKHGYIHTFPHSVTFTCLAGYVLKGVREIHCNSNGNWTSPTPVCKACPVGWYKADAEADSGDCVQCPDHTNTTTEGSSSQAQCVCQHGYNGPLGGPCQDVDECDTDNGGCQQICTNSPGRYKCGCGDGYIVVNKTRCRGIDCWERFHLQTQKESGVSSTCQTVPVQNPPISIESCCKKACEMDANVINMVSNICDLRRCDDVNSLELTTDKGGWDIYVLTNEAQQSETATGLRLSTLIPAIIVPLGAVLLVAGIVVTVLYKRKIKETNASSKGEPGPADAPSTVQNYENPGYDTHEEYLKSPNLCADSLEEGQYESIPDEKPAGIYEQLDEGTNASHVATYSSIH